MTDDMHREVRREGDTRTLVIRRRYDADVDDVWDAITTPERLDRWFLSVAGDLREGGRFEFGGDAATGTILRCDRPRLLRVTWEYGETMASEFEVRLSPDGDATRFELEHRMIPDTVDFGSGPVDPLLTDPVSGMWGMGTGWEMPLRHYLPRYLAGDLPNRPASEWFEQTPEVQAQADEADAAWRAVVVP
jgi:uncharacterized protein YndB with AHSA1/START domain